MEILVTGALGQLGSELRALALPSDGITFSDLVGEDGVLPLDVCDGDAVESLLRELGCKVLVNCAGYTSVDKAEDERQEADRLNHLAPKKLAQVCKKLGVTLIHISTDYIFNGLGSTPLREDSPAHPISVYGESKLAGEEAIRESGCSFIILRTAWMYSAFGRNFLLTMLSLMESRKSIGVVYDQVGSPTFAGDLAEVILKIIRSGQTDKCGTYNYSNEGAVSWYDFAQAIREIGDFGCFIKALRSEEYPTGAARPRYSVLDKSLIKTTFGVNVPYWRNSLEKCMASIIL